MRFALQQTSLIDFPGRLACVVFVPGCDLRCPFCHNPGLVEPGEEDRGGFIGEEELWAFLGKRKAVLEGIVLSGGEASLWPGLPDFIAQAKGLGFLVKLDTNGMRPEALETLQADYYAIDLKTLPRLYPERIPGAPADAEARLRRSVALVRSRKAPFEFRTTLAPGILELPELPSFSDILTTGDTWILQRFRPGHTLDPSWSERKPHTEEEHAAFLEAARSLCPAVRIR